MAEPNQTIHITLPPLKITLKDGQQATLEWQPQAQNPPAPAPSPEDRSRYEIKAYPISSTEGWTIEPAPPRREWMDRIPHGFAYRCLPLVMANQMGWIVRCPTDFEAVWNGQMHYLNSIAIRFKEEGTPYEKLIASHFGSGILTFSLPWLFRTPPGIGLMVRGATNFFKFNAAPLDGAIETDWSPYSFTMNWKIVEKDIPVKFSKGDPICMLVPYPMDLLERFDAGFVSMESDPKLKQDYYQWHQSRNSFNQRRDRTPLEWQKNYYGGKGPDNTPAPNHRTSFKLSRFDRSKPSPQEGES
ncbi:DUF6065 family protein [Oxynema aestuarii]|uniref:Uncharacterized protein n=1 Tax=Oxynema aestuarii AP17 TaxID=2064643 RepID=A0A6H1TVR4_9CYAN|nr:DUF6065 family protein [Oxynema aestuarii]QIZ70698.1 hypothetical protein HCG48_08995 [Oxynema aestuarii AP17]